MDSPHTTAAPPDGGAVIAGLCSFLGIILCLGVPEFVVFAFFIGDQLVVTAKLNYCSLSLSATFAAIFTAKMAQVYSVFIPFAISQRIIRFLTWHFDECSLFAPNLAARLNSYQISIQRPDQENPARFGHPPALVEACGRSPGKTACSVK